MSEKSLESDGVTKRLRFVTTLATVGLCVVAATFVGCGDGSTVEVRRYDNGQIKQEKTMRPGPEGRLLQDGPTTIYYENGNLMETKVYVRGQLQGELTLYYENGNKKAISVWKDGRMIKDWVKWDPKGNPIELDEEEKSSEAIP